MNTKIKFLIRHRAFLIAFLANLLFIGINFFVTNPKIVLASYGALVGLFLVVIYDLVNLIEKRFSESSYLEKLNSEYPEDFESKLEKSKTIDLLGIHLNSLLRSNKDNIEKALNSKSKIRIIIVPPNSEAIRMTSLRYNSEDTNITIDKENGRVRDTRSIIKTWQKNFPNQIELRESDYLFEHELVILDKLVIDTRYNFGAKPSVYKPKFFYKKNSDWYEFTSKEFENHWNRAVNVTFDK